MLPYLADNNKLYFIKISGEFIDIGLPEDYNKFKLFIKQKYEY